NAPDARRAARTGSRTRMPGRGSRVVQYVASHEPQEVAVPEAVIVAASRTPIGRAAKGSLADVRPDDLLAFAIDDVLSKAPGVPREDVVDVMVGCGFPQET